MKKIISIFLVLSATLFASTAYIIQVVSVTDGYTLL
ncbi:MAG: hypothetical protein ACI9TV_000994 [Sulfurimonas sp.]|jgi:hypothetical protein